MEFSYLSQEVASLEFKHLSGFLVALHDLQHQCKRGLERESLPLKLAVLASRDAPDFPKNLAP